MKCILSVILWIAVPMLLLAAVAQPSHMVTYDGGSLSNVKGGSERYSQTATTVTAGIKVADFSGSKASLLIQQAVSVTAGTVFMEALGTAGDDYASSVQQTSDGGFIVAGYTNGFGAGGQDVLLVKVDRSGMIQWAKTAGGTGSDRAFFVRQTSDGGYIVTGDTDSFTGVGQILVAKFDSTGKLQWA